MVYKRREECLRITGAKPQFKINSCKSKSKKIYIYINKYLHCKWRYKNILIAFMMLLKLTFMFIFSYKLPKKINVKNSSLIRFNHWQVKWFIFSSLFFFWFSFFFYYFNLEAFHEIILRYVQVYTGNIVGNSRCWMKHFTFMNERWRVFYCM